MDTVVAPQRAPGHDRGDGCRVTARQDEGCTVLDAPAGADGGVDLTRERDGQRSLVQRKHWKRRNVEVKTIHELHEAGFKRLSRSGFDALGGRLSVLRRGELPGAAFRVA